MVHSHDTDKACQADMLQLLLDLLSEDDFMENIINIIQHEYLGNKKASKLGSKFLLYLVFTFHSIF